MQLVVCSEYGKIQSYYIILTKFIPKCSQGFEKGLKNTNYMYICPAPLLNRDNFYSKRERRGSNNFSIKTNLNIPLKLPEMRCFKDLVNAVIVESTKKSLNKHHLLGEDIRSRLR